MKKIKLFLLLLFVVLLCYEYFGYFIKFDPYINYPYSNYLSPQNRTLILWNKRKTIKLNMEHLNFPIDNIRVSRPQKMSSWGTIGGYHTLCRSLVLKPEIEKVIPLQDIEDLKLEMIYTDNYLIIIEKKNNQYQATTYEKNNFKIIHKNFVNHEQGKEIIKFLASDENLFFVRIHNQTIDAPNYESIVKLNIRSLNVFDSVYEEQDEIKIIQKNETIFIINLSQFYIRIVSKKSNNKLSNYINLRKFLFSHENLLSFHITD